MKRPVQTASILMISNASNRRGANWRPLVPLALRRCFAGAVLALVPGAAAAAPLAPVGLPIASVAAPIETVACIRGGWHGPGVYHGCGYYRPGYPLRRYPYYARAYYPAAPYVAPPVVLVEPVLPAPRQCWIAGAWRPR